MSLPELRQPRWVAYGQDSKAHLIDAAQIGLVAWCGASLQTDDQESHNERCRACVDAVAKFHDLALAAPPATLTERITLLVTRPATSEPFDVALARKFRANTTWHIEIEQMEPLDA